MKGETTDGEGNPLLMVVTRQRQAWLPARQTAASRRRSLVARTSFVLKCRQGPSHGRAEARSASPAEAGGMAQHAPDAIGAGVTPGPFPCHTPFRRRRVRPRRARPERSMRAWARLARFWAALPLASPCQPTATGVALRTRVRGQ